MMNRFGNRRLAIVGAVLACVIAALTLHNTYRLQASSGDVDRIHTSAPNDHQAVAVIAGGCFWAMQAMFSQLKGVDEVVPGYAGGNTPSPTYDEVCTHTTGYAESIRIVFEPKVISYADLLKVFFTVHDPTQLDGQGDDEGTNYRSAVFFLSAQQKSDAEQAVAEANRERGGNVVVTQVVPFTNFYAAETYHNNYFELHPDEDYCQEVVAPKVEKFRDHWHDWLKQ